MRPLYLSAALPSASLSASADPRSSGLFLTRLHRQRRMRLASWVFAWLVALPLALPLVSARAEAASVVAQATAAVPSPRAVINTLTANAQQFAAQHFTPLLVGRSKPQATPTPLMRSGLQPLPSTLLDDVGHLSRPVPQAQVDGWVKELKDGQTLPARKALLHLWMGEWQLAHDKQPHTAEAHFAQAQRLTRPTDAVHGLAAYDNGIALFYQGAYQSAAEAFGHALRLRVPAHSFEHLRCALWLKDSAACARYHGQHAASGIPEPPQLDPYCGAAALAACLRNLGMPSDYQTLRNNCKVGGEGSTLQDVLEAGQRLGTVGRVFKADDKGLMALPKPLVAYVEHDHFIAVVKADKAGVSYLCSDCGAWPGGQVDLTWKQWHLMEAGLYASFSKPGSAWDATLNRVAYEASPFIKVSGTQVASVGSLHGLNPFQTRVFLGPLSLMRGHVIRLAGSAAGVDCGTSPMTYSCPAGGHHPMDKGSKFDPVDLSTGQEEYQPAPDLMVYNPKGPSIVWQRLYDHLRGPGQEYTYGSLGYDPTYQSDDFGVGWSQNYNVGVIDSAASYSLPTASRTVLFPNGSRIDFQGTTAPTAAAPVVYLPATRKGVPMVLEWDYVASEPSHFAVLFKDRTRWIMGSLPTGSAPAPGGVHVLTQISDRNNHSIYFNYTTTGSGSSASRGWPLLTSITSSPSGGGTQFLTITRSTAVDSFGYAFPTPYITAVTDNYGRSIYYQAQTLHNPYCNYAYYYQELTQVSQVVPTGSSSPPPHWTYGYMTVPNGEAYEQVNYLHKISMPSPTGSGNSSSYIWYGNTPNTTADADGNYNPNATFLLDSTSGYGFPYVSALVDGNGYARLYYSVDTSSTPTYQNGYPIYPPSTSTSAVGNPGYSAASSYSQSAGYTQVVIKNLNLSSSQNPIYTYIAGYDTYMNETSRTDGAGTMVSQSNYNFSTSGFNPVTTTDGNLQATTYAWDNFGNMTGMTPPSNTHRSTAATVNTWDYSNFVLGEMTQSQTGTKTPVTYTYNDSATQDYHNSGLVKTITMSAPGDGSTADHGTGSTVTTTYTYDNLGNPTVIQSPGNNTGTYLYTYFNYTSDPGSTTPNIPSASQTNMYSQPLTITRQGGGSPTRVTHLRYDSQGNIATLYDALGHETDYAFTIDNQLYTTTLPHTGQSGGSTGNAVIKYKYKYTNSGATNATWPIADALRYGSLANVTTADESGTLVRQVSYTYGQEGELTNVTGSTEPVSYAYDALYRLASLTDGNSHQTTYFYTPQGYLYQTVYPGAVSTPPTSPLTPGHADTVTYAATNSGGSLISGYDGSGNLLGRIDGNDVETDYTRSLDPQSLVTTVHYKYPTGWSGVTTSDVTLAYDTFGRLQTLTNGVEARSYGTGTGGSTVPGYDDLDNVLNVQSDYTYSGMPAKSMAYAYYPDGSRQSLTTPAGAFTYSYDSDGRMTSMLNPFSEKTQWAYQDNNWLGAQYQNYSNATTYGAKTAYTYDARGEMTDLKTTNSSSTNLTEFAVPSASGYDGAGSRLSVTATAASGQQYGVYTGTTTYAYDAGQTTASLRRSQLTGEAYTATGTGTSYTRSQGYDQATSGSASSSTGPGNPTTFRSTFRSFNSDNQDTANTYDGNGSPTGYGTKTLTYDAENRLISYGSGGTAALTCGYTPDGLRAFKQSGSATPVYYLYDGDEPVCELDTTSGFVGLVKRVNTFGANGFVSRKTINDQMGGTLGATGYYTFDLQGNAVQRLDNYGVPQVSYQTDAFGKVSSSDGNGITFGFGGQFGYSQDSETGLVLCTHRFYDPANGRWLTRDPIGYGGGINLYGYVQNNSLNLIDPEGYDGKTSINILRLLCALLSVICSNKIPIVPGNSPTAPSSSPMQPPVDPPPSDRQGGRPGGGSPEGPTDSPSPPQPGGDGPNPAKPQPLPVDEPAPSPSFPEGGPPLGPIAIACIIGTLALQNRAGGPGDTPPHYINEPSGPDHLTPWVAH